MAFVTNYLDDSSISLTPSTSEQLMYNPDGWPLTTGTTGRTGTTNMEQAIEKRINKIYKRLKETNRNLKSMEKLMNENELEDNYPEKKLTVNDSTCLLATSKLTKSLQDIYSAGQIHDPFFNQPANLQKESNLIHHKLSSLENQHTKLQNSMESINKCLDTIKDPLKAGQDQVQSALIELKDQLTSTTRELKETKKMYSEREKSSKYKAKKSIQSWKNKYESLYIDKRHLDEQMNKFKDQNYMLLREQEILRARLEEVQQRIENEAKQQIYLNNLLSKCKDECLKKDDSLNLLNGTYNNTKCEVSLLKSEIEKLEKKINSLTEQNADLIKTNLSLEHQLKSQENKIKKDELNLVEKSNDAERIKKLEEENYQLHLKITDLQINANKMSDFDLKESKDNIKLALKNENLLGELDGLKSEFQELKAKHEQALKDYYVKSEECIGKDKRILKLEKSIKESCKMFNYKDQEFKMMLVGISFEIDKVANLWNSVSGNSVSFQELLNLSTPCSSHSKLHLVDIQSKLKILQDELGSFKNSAAISNNRPNSAIKSPKNVELLKQNVLGKVKTKQYQNQELNIGPKKVSSKVHSTKINPSLLMSSINENISSFKSLHNSSLTLSSIHKSTSSSEETSS